MAEACAVSAFPSVSFPRASDGHEKLASTEVAGKLTYK